MTKQRKDTHSTEFGLWLRKQPQIDSLLGYASTNIDYIWYDYKKFKWMILEEKRYMGDISYSQGKIFELIKKNIRDDINYMGFHVIMFKKTNPEDGKIWLDGKEIDKIELIEFLQFKKPYEECPF